MNADREPKAKSQRLIWPQMNAEEREIEGKEVFRSAPICVHQRLTVLLFRFRCDSAAIPAIPGPPDRAVFAGWGGIPRDLRYRIYNERN
jgi:hypothetical protein